MGVDYEIYVRGRLGPEMQHLLSDLRPHLRPGHTRLSAVDADQAILHGILARLQDLGLEVDSLWRVDSSPVNGSADRLTE